MGPGAAGLLLSGGSNRILLTQRMYEEFDKEMKRENGGRKDVKGSNHSANRSLT